MLVGRVALLDAGWEAMLNIEPPVDLKLSTPMYAKSPILHNKVSVTSSPSSMTTPNLRLYIICKEHLKYLIAFYTSQIKQKGRPEINLLIYEVIMGGEYIFKQMQEYCCSKGIKQTMGPPHTPELNGVAERYNQTLLDHLKPSLKHSSLHCEFWSDALDYAVWTTNRSPTKPNEGFKTPFELYENKVPSMRHSHIFGSKGVYLVPSSDRRKMDNHSCECYFLGVLPHGDGVKVPDKSSNKIIKTRNAVFDEVENSIEDPHNLPANHNHHSDTTPWLFPDDTSPVDDDSGTVDQHQNQQDHDPNPIIHRPTRNHQPPSRSSNLRAHTATVANSPTYRTAINSADCESWIAAMKAEIDSIIDRNVFTLVPQPSNRKIISCRWHLKKKFYQATFAP